ncbi:lectin-like domain-containing protein [Enterococcus sp. AZ179]|uniref:lectin-like domain-containing protein n=1 Tax=Enterococcus sp. AZ179 TaxID=2774680 RepID=UPI003D27D776
MYKELFKKIVLILISSLSIVGFTNTTQADDNLLGTEVPNPPGVGVPLENYFSSPNGNAIITGSNNSVLQMTNGTSQLSSIWSKNTIDLRYDFTFEAFIYMGKETQLGNAADGITFSLIDNSLGNSYLGNDGSALGIYNTDKSNPKKDVPGITVELDTYYNGDGLDSKLYVNGSSLQSIDSFYDHIAITNTDEIGKKNLIANPNDTWGAWDSSFHYGVQFLGDNNASNVTPYTSLSDGSWKKIKISWESSVGSLGIIEGKISYDLQTISGNSLAYGEHNVSLGLTNNVANVNYRTPGRNVYWGFTASTGANAANNLIAITRMPTSPQVEQVVSTNLDTVEQNQEIEISIENKKLSGESDWTNVYTTLDLSDLEEFEYIEGSAMKNGVTISDPIVDNDKKYLQFETTQTISDSEIITLKIKPKTSKENIVLNSWATGDQTSASANTVLEVTSPIMSAEANNPTYYVGTDINSVDLKDFIKSVELAGSILESNQYKVQLLDNFLDLNQVGNYTKKVLVTAVNDTNKAVEIDVPVNVLWGNTLVAKDAVLADVIASISLLDKEGSPFLVANKGDGLSPSNDSENRAYFQIYSQNLNESDMDLGWDETSPDALDQMVWFNSILKENVNDSLKYGNVVSVAVFKDNNFENNYFGENTWISRSEQLVKETEGYYKAFYELTPNGYSLLHINQLTTNSVDVPIFSSEEYLDEHVSELIDLQSYSNISIKGFSEYPKTNESGQQEGKVIVEETLTTGGTVQYEYDVEVNVKEGSLTLAVPQIMNFKDFQKSQSDQIIERESSGDLGLIVNDSRGENVQGNWTLTAQVSTDDGIAPYLVYRDEQGNDSYLSRSAVQVYTQTKQTNVSEPLQVEISALWKSNSGILLNVPSKNNLFNQSYSTTITWNLVEGP